MHTGNVCEHLRSVHNHVILFLPPVFPGLTLSDERRQQLVRFTGYNLETRYPEDRALLRERYSKQYAVAEIDVVREVGSWLKLLLQQERPSGSPAENE
jgi:hypothetical protein